MPTEVTCHDPETGDRETQSIEDDWLLVVDGDVYLDHVAQYGNGTVVLTVKRRRRGE